MSGPARRNRIRVAVIAINPGATSPAPVVATRGIRFSPALFPRALAAVVAARSARAHPGLAVAAVKALFADDDVLLDLQSRYGLTRRQGLILRRLVAARGRTVGREALLLATGEIEIDEDDLRKTIARLRSRLPVPIRTARQGGYALDDWKRLWPIGAAFSELPDDSARVRAPQDHPSI